MWYEVVQATWMQNLHVLLCIFFGDVEIHRRPTTINFREWCNGVFMWHMLVSITPTLMSSHMNA